MKKSLLHFFFEYLFSKNGMPYNKNKGKLVVHFVKRQGDFDFKFKMPKAFLSDYVKVAICVRNKTKKNYCPY